MTSGKGISRLDPSRLALLNEGVAEAATLTECLAVDFAALMGTAFPDIGETAVAALRHAAGEGITRRMALAAQLILAWRGMSVLDPMRDHPSDTVRGWACFMIGTVEGWTLSDRLVGLRPFADDSHFGVREWAWLAVRPHIAADLDTAIAQLSPWTAAPSERLRRYASEATRPRGVWCAHIGALRQRPEQALPILEPLRADPAPYVQDSVGNWLNDAGKDRPDWVRSLCARWAVESTIPATARICKRALRSLDRER